MVTLTIFCFYEPSTSWDCTLSLPDALPILARRRTGIGSSIPRLRILSLLAGPERTSQTRLGRIVGRSQGSACVSYQPRSQLCRSEEHTSELSHRCSSYAVFSLKKKKQKTDN